MSNQLIKVRLDEDHDDIQLGLHMIKRHRPDGFIPADLQKNDNGSALEADVKDCVTLEAHLQRSILSDTDLATLIISVIKPINQLERIYLDADYVDLQFHNVFYDYRQNGIALVYGIAPKNCEAIEGRVCSFIRELVYEYSRLEKPNSQFVSKILSYLKEPAWHLKGLMYLLEEQLSQPAIKRQDEKMTSHCYPLSANTDSKSVPNVNSKKMIINKELNEEAFDLRDKIEKRKLLYGVLLIIAGALFGVIRTLDISPAEKAGTVLIAGALLGFIAKWLYKRSEIEKNEERYGLASKLQRMTSEVSTSNDDDCCDANQNSKARFVVKKNVIERTGGEDRTVMAKQPVMGCALTEKSGQKILLNREMMIIGRQEGVADILIKDNTSVGRQHAKLIKLSSGYAVKDLKSINGTYVNDKKVIPDQPIALMNGDVLRVSDERFTFHSKW